MPKKRFDLTPPPRTDDPIQFALGDEWFTCLDDAPVAAVHALNVRRNAIVGTFDFIRGVLVPDDEDRFEQVVASKDTVVPEGVLAEVLTYLIGEYTGRPTLRPGSSPGGPQATNDGSQASLTSGADATP